ncbi:DUF4352 domain-containing protein [Streptomyces seoulensis]|uniref:DUF4352 domain-containing protein n=1 Tax=Streptomyces seoulensis TaxID=73044 RepID=A0A4P6U015_STRSO|nr:DUF4352 domain-containing protein [Streptomyces seoulensis]QBJ93405.1 DUF4352 domain-containing protein [Streptomyces seoulensis]
MNQQPQQPGWNGQQQPGQQPQGWAGPSAPQQWGPPPQPPKKKAGAGKIIGLGCLGVIGLFVLIGIIAAVASGGDSDEGSKKPAATVGSTPKGEPGKKADDTKADKPTGPVQVTAKKAAFKKTILASGDNYTSVSVTIAATGKAEVHVNPLYCSIIDSTGSKHATELAVDEDQLDTTKLAPGEKTTGSITGKGKFTPKYVSCTDGLIGDAVRADVS